MLRWPSFGFVDLKESGENPGEDRVDESAGMHAMGAVDEARRAAEILVDACHTAEQLLGMRI